MKEVKLHYFVPENEEELEGLVGKNVGVKLCIGNPIEPMVFAGIFTDPQREYEFLMQGIDGKDGEKVPLKRIWGFRILADKTPFNTNGINLSGYHIKRYDPTSGNYDCRLQALKQNNQWREPK